MMDRLTKVENELEAQGTTIAMLEQELEAQGATIAMLAQRIELLLIQGNNDREQTAFNEEPAFTQEDKTMTTVNEKGFCVGDEVKIISDKQSFWSVSGRRKPTTLEGAVGVITRVTRCTTFTGKTRITIACIDSYTFRIIESIKTKFHHFRQQ